MGGLRKERGPQWVASRQLQGTMLRLQGLAVEGELHLEGQPIYKAIQEALGREKEREEFQLGE